MCFIQIPTLSQDLEGDITQYNLFGQFEVMNKVLKGQQSGIWVGHVVEKDNNILLYDVTPQTQHDFGHMFLSSNAKI